MSSSATFLRDGGSLADHLFILLVLLLVVAYFLHLFGLLSVLSPSLDVIIAFAVTIGTEPSVSTSFSPRDAAPAPSPPSPPAPAPAPAPAPRRSRLFPGIVVDATPFFRGPTGFFENPGWANPIPRPSPLPELSPEAITAARVRLDRQPSWAEKQRLSKQQADAAAARVLRVPKKVRFADEIVTASPPPPLPQSPLLDLPGKPLARFSSFLSEHHEEVWFLAPGACSRRCRCVSCAAAGNAVLLESERTATMAEQSHLEILRQEFASLAPVPAEQATVLLPQPEIVMAAPPPAAPVFASVPAPSLPPPAPSQPQLSSGAPVAPVATTIAPSAPAIAKASPASIVPAGPVAAPSVAAAAATSRPQKSSGAPVASVTNVNGAPQPAIVISWPASSPAPSQPPPPAPAPQSAAATTTFSAAPAIAPTLSNPFVGIASNIPACCTVIQRLMGEIDAFKALVKPGNRQKGWKAAYRQAWVTHGTDANCNRFSDYLAWIENWAYDREVPHGQRHKLSASQRRSLGLSGPNMIGLVDFLGDGSGYVQSDSLSRLSSFARAIHRDFQ